jgi:hypothetical protein
MTKMGEPPVSQAKPRNRPSYKGGQITHDPGCLPGHQVAQQVTPGSTTFGAATRAYHDHAALLVFENDIEILIDGPEYHDLPASNAADRATAGRTAHHFGGATPLRATPSPK